MNSLLFLYYFLQESYEAAKSLKNNFFQGMCLILAQAPTVGAQFYEARKMKVTKRLKVHCIIYLEM